MPKAAPPGRNRAWKSQKSDFWGGVCRRQRPLVETELGFGPQGAQGAPRGPMGPPWAPMGAQGAQGAPGPPCWGVPVRAVYTGFWPTLMSWCRGVLSVLDVLGAPVFCCPLCAVCPALNTGESDAGLKHSNGQVDPALTGPPQQGPKGPKGPLGPNPPSWGQSIFKKFTKIYILQFVGSKMAPKRCDPGMAGPRKA